MDQGGVTSSLRNFCKQLHRLEFHVDLLNMDGCYAVDIEGVNFLNLEGKTKYWNFGKQAFLSKNILEKISLLPLILLKKITNKRGKWLNYIFRGYQLNDSYDIVFAYNQCAPCFYFALNCVDAKKYIAVIHGDIEFMGDISSWSNMLSRFDQIACVSKAVTDGFRSRFNFIRDKFATLYNMLDIDMIKHKANESTKYIFDPSIINIVSVARHDNAHKAVDRIPEIISLLLQRSINKFHWYIVGGGEDFEYNVRYSQKLGVSNYITFCGPLDNPFPIMKKSDFLVLTSYTEAFGMVIAEAHVLNRPTIAAAYPSVYEVIDDGYNGLVAEQSVISLADKVAEMLTNFTNVRTYMENYLVCNPFNNSIAISQLLSLIEEK